MPVNPSDVREFSKSGPVYMTIESNEDRRKRLAGRRDYCLILGITVEGKRADNGETYIEQYPVIEVWDRNDMTFNSAAECHTLGMHFLGKRMHEVLDFYRFTWAVASDEFSHCRITGFTVQPTDREEDGGSSEWSFWVGSNTQLKDFLRKAFAYSENPEPLPEPFDIAKHIQSAFADKHIGTFLTVAQIVAHPTDLNGGHRPGAGAVSARLFPATGTCNIPGIVTARNLDGVKGAIKIGA